MAEVSVEQQILTTVQGLDQKVEKVQKNGDFLRLMLLGDVNSETKHGRVPMAEADIRQLFLRVEKVEEQQIRWKAYTAAAAAIGGVAGSVAGVIIAVVVELLKR